MNKELEQDKYKGLGNGTWDEGYFPAAKQECIWGIPENKRNCKYCTANCVNAHATSETTVTIAQKTTDKIPTDPTDFTMTEASGELKELEQAARIYSSPGAQKDPEHWADYPYNPEIKRAVMYGAEWQKDIIKKEINDILNDCVARFGCRTPDYYDGAVDACKFLLNKYKEEKK